MSRPLDTLHAFNAKLGQTFNIQKLPEIEELDLAESQKLIETLCQETRTRILLAFFIFKNLNTGGLTYHDWSPLRDSIKQTQPQYSPLVENESYSYESYPLPYIKKMVVRCKLYDLWYKSPEEFFALLQGRWRRNMDTANPPGNIGALTITRKTRRKTFKTIGDLGIVADTESWDKLLSRETKHCISKRHRKNLDTASLSKPLTWSTEEYLDFVKEGLLPFLEVAAAYYKTLASDQLWEEWQQISEQVDAFQTSRADTSQQFQGLAENELPIITQKMEDFYEFINELYSKIDELRQKTYLAIAQEKSSNSKLIQNVDSSDTVVERKKQALLLIYEIEELARTLYGTCQNLGERLEKPLTI